MRAWLHTEIAEFVRAAEGLLRADQFTTNLIAVFPERAVAHTDPPRPEHLWGDREVATDLESQATGIRLVEPERGVCRDVA